MKVDLTQEQIEWILGITEPRVAMDPTGIYGDPANAIDLALRAALEKR